MSIINYLHNLDIDTLQIELEEDNTTLPEIEEIRFKGEYIKVACKRALIKKNRERGEL